MLLLPQHHAADPQRPAWPPAATAMRLLGLAKRLPEGVFETNRPEGNTHSLSSDCLGSAPAIPSPPQPLCPADRRLNLCLNTLADLGRPAHAADSETSRENKIRARETAQAAHRAQRAARIWRDGQGAAQAVLSSSARPQLIA